jgi:hypothetical protein
MDFLHQYYSSPEEQGYNPALEPEKNTIMSVNTEKWEINGETREEQTCMEEITPD